MNLLEPDYVGHATELAASAIDPITMSSLALHCPGLKRFDWMNYLRCSKCRIEKVLDTVQKYGGPDGMKILDFGSWLGNFSLALGLKYPITRYQIVASEMWARYSPALDAQKKLLAINHIDVIDMSMIVGRPQGPAYDIVLFMSVIEHISDSPRFVLQTLYHCLKPGGLLIMDTPNLAHVANRRKLNRGESPYVAIDEQFYTCAPFEGHVREYTMNEVLWMLRQTGFFVVDSHFFDYSDIPFWKSPLATIEKGLDPTRRELIYVVARKP
jgi:2-polyprenyl-3-methyl-5-hydroxy-6-metoxy-1,4-benzoquinol methylase